MTAAGIDAVPGHEHRGQVRERPAGSEGPFAGRVAHALAQGAEAVVGGTVDRGDRFVAPTVLRGVTPEMGVLLGLAGAVDRLLQGRVNNRNPAYGPHGGLQHLGVVTVYRIRAAEDLADCEPVGQADQGTQVSGSLLSEARHPDIFETSDMEAPFE